MALLFAYGKHRFSHDVALIIKVTEREVLSIKYSLWK